MSLAVGNPVPPETITAQERSSKKSIKLVTCIVRSEKLDALTNALNRLNLVGGMTITDVRGVGHETAHPELYRGMQFVHQFVPRIRVELVIEGGDVREVEKVVTEITRTGELGDGKIFIVDVIDAQRIRTSERGTSAL